MGSTTDKALCGGIVAELEPLATAAEPAGTRFGRRYDKRIGFIRLWQ